MKITLVLARFDLSGGARVVAQHAEQLRRRGHEVLLVGCPPQQIPLRRRIKSFLRGNGFPPPARQGPSHVDGLAVPVRVLERHRPLRDSDVPDADVIVATWWETAEWVAALGRSKGAKAHFVQGDEADPAWLWPAHLPRAIAAHRLPLHKITISRTLAAMLRARYDVSDLSIVPNAVDLDLFRAPPRGRQLRPTVGLLYSTFPLKGCDVALRAIELVARRIPDVRVVSFGLEGSSPALPLPPGSAHHVMPPQHLIRALYAQCDVWLCGSRSEGFHLPPLEAMACRTPVVSTCVGGPADIVVDGVNGYLAPIGDVDALAERLRHVLALSGEAWRELSEGAHRTAARYTPDDATDRLEHALRIAIDRERGAGDHAGRPHDAATRAADGEF